MNQLFEKNASHKTSQIELSSGMCYQIVNFSRGNNVKNQAIEPGIEPVSRLPGDFSTTKLPNRLDLDAIYLQVKRSLHSTILRPYRQIMCEHKKKKI